MIVIVIVIIIIIIIIIIIVQKPICRPTPGRKQAAYNIIHHIIGYDT